MRALSLALICFLGAAARADCKNTEPKNKAGKQNGTSISCTGNGGWEERPYVDGVEHGVTRIFRGEGKQESEVTYVKGKPNGPFRRWHDNGKLAEEGTKKDYKVNGIRKEYSEEGKLKLVESYKDGELDGERKVFFDEGKFGKIESVESFKMGKKHGKWRRFHENGKPREEYSWADGDRDGEQREFDEKGQLMVQQSLKAGKTHGWKHEYYDNSDGYYLNSARYDKEGQSVVLATFHANGTTDHVTCYDKNGNPGEDRTPCKPYLDELAKLTGKKTVASAAGDTDGFYADGKPKSVCPTKVGKRHGKCVRYSEEGTVTWSGEFDEGEQNGDFIENFGSGKPKKVSTYRKGKLTQVVEYYDEGQVKKTTQLRDERELASKELYQNGNVKEETEWKGDKQIVRGYHDNGKLAVRGILIPSTQCFYGCWTSKQFEGKVERFTEKGKLYESGEWKSGQPHGKHFSYFANGKVSEESVYDNGRRVSEKTYASSGKLRQSVEYFKDGSRKVKKGS